MELTHASFFSGVGGLDLGLERAGWRTVSFSEIDPYASAVLAERWPGVPNLGDITDLASTERPVSARNLDSGPGRRGASGDRADREQSQPTSGGRRIEPGADGSDWRRASLWTGGFPCQDLSVAGKRRGMGTEDERTRSGLAYAFLDLVERHRPPAILLENVPGLLSSNGGKDLGALLGRLGELGYWWAYRILDAQFFGVPQRRRRVFICALHAGAGFGADSAAAVLSVGARCGGHSAAGDEAREGTARCPTPGVDIARAITGTSGKRHDDDTDTLISGSLKTGPHHGWRIDAEEAASGRIVVSPSPDASGVREADGLAGRLDDRELSPTLRVGPQRPRDGGPGDTVPIIAATLNSGGNDGGFRTEPREHLVSQPIRTNPYNNSDPGMEADMHYFSGPPSGDDPLLPLGLDSHRYRCCGNGVVSNVAEWIGQRLRQMVQ